MKIETVVVGTKRSSKVDSRQYSVVDAGKMYVFASDQRTITYRAMHEAGENATIAQIAEIAAKHGLKSKTPVEASVRFHAAILVKEGYVTVQ